MFVPSIFLQLACSLGLSAPPSVPPSTPAPAPSPQSASLPRSIRDTLGPLFERANADPAGVVPLILRASAALEGKLETESIDRATGRLAGGSAEQQTLSQEDLRLLADTLEPYCRRVFFSPERLIGAQKLGILNHLVKSGEVPERIAKRYRIGTDLLAYLNKDFDPKKLQEGQQLKVLDLSGGSLLVDVSKSLFRVGAWRKLENGAHALLMYAPVGLGAADSPTPEGKSWISLRVRDPEWTDPTTKEVYKPGDPRNVLGGYWIALDPTGIGKSGIGFHGFTGEPAANWIEQPASHGCIRMLQGDVDRLFCLAIERTDVEIRP
jgi:lipoprotein-anchoring transpeptidase ErfK/SrfK